MGREIERKFLLKNDSWRQGAIGTAYRQGYIRTVERSTVRVRIAGDKAFLTIKGPTKGASRSEYEYQIPVAEANEILDELCAKPLIEKKRYVVEYHGLKWEIDEFFGENEGLFLAEIELQDEDQAFDLPEWAGKEVTGDRRYYNARLTQNPYYLWKPSE